MSHEDHRSLALGITAIVVATAACLPRGEPPSGIQVVAGRENTLGAPVPANGDGVLRVLFFRERGDDAHDLYVVSVDAAGGPPSERLLVPDVDPTVDFGCIYMIAPCGMVDPNGMAWVYTAGGGLVHANPFTGDVTDVPYLSQRSATGDRYLSYNRDLKTTTLYGPDGPMAELTIDPLVGSQFFGEDFYYVTPAAALMHVSPDGAQEQIAMGVKMFQGEPTSDGLLLIVTRGTLDPMVMQLSVRDPATGQERVLPFGGGMFTASVAVSSDRWLVGIDYNYTESATSTPITFFDYRSGTQTIVDVPGRIFFVSSGNFRPGTHELWVTSEEGTESPSIWIVSPDAAPASIPGVAFRGFTPDGAYWLSSWSTPDVMFPMLQVGRTDDLTAPVHVVTSEGIGTSAFAQLPDGRLLSAVYTKKFERSDVFVIDPDTGDRRLLAERGRTAAFGDKRLLGMYHFQGGRGDLIAVDIDSGAQTMLAPEFTVTAFAEPRGTDLVPPGARVVYGFQARTASPYDGIWVANIP